MTPLPFSNENEAPPLDPDLIDRELHAQVDLQEHVAVWELIVRYYSWFRAYYQAAAELVIVNGRLPATNESYREILQAHWPPSAHGRQYRDAIILVLLRELLEREGRRD